MHVVLHWTKEGSSTKSICSMKLGFFAYLLYPCVAIGMLAKDDFICGGCSALLPISIEVVKCPPEII